MNTNHDSVGRWESRSEKKAEPAAKVAPATPTANGAQEKLAQ
jgi:hypothetical protein